MPRQYPTELWRSRTSSASSASLSTLCTPWRRQAFIDAGQRPGANSYEPDPLQATRASKNSRPSSRG